MTEDSYPVTERNRVKPAHDRARYDRASVHAILDAALLCHVAYVIDGQPFATPTAFWRHGDTLYWHGSSASRMMRHLKAGVPVCLTVAHLDSLVLARSGFNHSVDYRSAMCFGTARLVEDPAEKIVALDAMIDRFYPGRAAALRTATPQEIKATAVIAMEIEEAVGKVRDKGIVDDEADYAHPVWAGIVPVTTVLGAPEPCPRLLDGMTPGADVGPYQAGRTLDDALTEAQALYDAGH